MSGPVPGLLDPARTALLVIDVQLAFARVMPDFEGLAERCARMADVGAALELPIFATEQYPRGLGATAPVLRTALRDVVVESKTSFSSLGCDGVRAGLQGGGVRQVLVCGVETHVCVLQTVHELLAAGLEPHVLADCVLSRNEVDRTHALERMARAGAVVTTSEAAAFELLRDAEHPSFKQIQQMFL